jgi:hypothetical protein
MSQHKFQPLDLTAGGLSLGLIMLVVLVILAGTWEGMRVNLINLDEDNKVGPYGPIVFSFSDTVDQTPFKSLFSIQPDIPGCFEWLDAKTVRFIPLKPLQPNIDYRVSIKPGVLGKDGIHLRKEYAELLKVRESRIVYLALVNKKRQLWSVGVNGKSPQQLGNFDKNIFDFDVAPNGEYVIFSAVNEKQGVDLWYLDRRGVSPRLLLDCGLDHCITPTISPDSQQVVYTREIAPISPSMPFGAPRIRLLNIQSGDDHSLYSDPQIIGYGPGWSPDGRRITSYDGVQQMILVVSPESGDQVSLSSKIGATLSWSADSGHLLFTDVEDTLDGPRTVVKMADFSTGEVSDIIGAHDDHDYQYGALALSPAGDQIVLGLQFNTNDPTQSLLLMNPDMQEGGESITNDPNMVYNTPRWNQWGTALIFQQIKLKEVHVPEIAVWMPGFKKPQVLAQGLWPHWLP